MVVPSVAYGLLGSNVSAIFRTPSATSAARPLDYVWCGRMPSPATIAYIEFLDAISVINVTIWDLLLNCYLIVTTARLKRLQKIRFACIRLDSGRWRILQRRP